MGKYFLVMCKNILVVCFLIATTLIGNAQVNIDFQYYIANHHLQYCPPSGFADLEGTVYLKLNPTHKIPNRFMYSQINNEGDIIIAYNINPRCKDVNDNDIKKGLFSSWINSQADLTRSPVKYLNKTQLEIINATDGAEYDLFIGPTRDYHKLKKCKVRIIYRENVGAASIFYFYNTESEEKVDAVMKKSASILKFKPGFFSPPSCGTPIDAGN